MAQLFVAQALAGVLVDLVRARHHPSAGIDHAGAPAGRQALLGNDVRQLPGGGGGIERHDDAPVLPDRHAHGVDQVVVQGAGEQVRDAGFAVRQDAPQQWRAGQRRQRGAVRTPGGHQHLAVGIEHQDAVGVQVGQRFDGARVKTGQVAGRQHARGAKCAQRHLGVAEIVFDGRDHGVGAGHRVADQLGALLVVKADDDEGGNAGHR